MNLIQFKITNTVYTVTENVTLVQRDCSCQQVKGFFQESFPADYSNDWPKPLKVMVDHDCE